MVLKFEAKNAWGGRVNDIRTYYSLCQLQELELFRNLFIKQVFPLKDD